MDFVEIGKSLGLPGLVLCGLGYGLCRIIVWAGHNVVKPMLDAHMDFLQKNQEHDQKQTELLTKMQADAERHRQMAASHFDACELMSNRNATVGAAKFELANNPSMQ
jgi:demethoxyubiquinone hydroxylase (CLK1/Coq7/Cat5 family)